VAGERASMRKVAEVLRLHFELGWSQRQIARSSCLSTSTVHEYVLRFQAAGLGWPLPAGWGEAELVAALHPVSAPAARPPSRAQPEFARVQAEMQASKHTTLQLLWEEYRAAEPAGYTYSRYCHLYRRWLKQGELVLRQNHRPGEKLFTDWAGATIPIYDPATGDADPASIFVAVLGASNYTWAEAFINQTLTSWLAGHVHAFEFFGGVPEMVVPDNPRTAVTRAHRYEPDLNPSYQQMALHYGVGVLPARPYKPRDKAKVESGVLVVERWIVAALRHRRFHSLAELNLAIRELLDRLNQRPFKKRPGSRASLFAELDQPALRPLPAQPFELAEWRMATVNIDYHIQFDHAFYSVPYHLARQKVEVRATAETIEIFHRGQRVASHRRTHQAHIALTDPEHRPKAHRAHLEWPPSRMIAWAQQTGPHTAAVVERILDSFPHPENGYRSCLGVIRLGGRYGPQRLEAAAQRAVATGCLSYRSLDSILRHRLDTEPLDASPATSPAAAHANLRGSGYYQ
jgi:transposase